MVKFLDTEQLFVTGTSQGEVKFWSAAEGYDFGTLNSTSWDEKRLKEYIRETGKRLRK